ncbi:MAG: hypothetical protein ACXVRJ_13460 [Gaiellaceae bacterium]
MNRGQTPCRGSDPNELPYEIGVVQYVVFAPKNPPQAVVVANCVPFPKSFRKPG